MLSFFRKVPYLPLKAACETHGIDVPQEAKSRGPKKLACAQALAAAFPELDRQVQRALLSIGAFKPSFADRRVQVRRQAKKANPYYEEIWDTFTELPASLNFRTQCLPPITSWSPDMLDQRTERHEIAVKQIVRLLDKVGEFYLGTYAPNTLTRHQGAMFGFTFSDVTGMTLVRIHRVCWSARVGPLQAQFFISSKAPQANQYPAPIICNAQLKPDRDVVSIVHCQGYDISIFLSQLWSVLDFRKRIRRGMPSNFLTTLLPLIWDYAQPIYCTMRVV